jgi:hypothetical protein
VVNFIVVNEPLRDGRHARISTQRTRIDVARCIKALGEDHYPAAARVALVLDYRNTHSPASFYHVFPPTEAKRLAHKQEIHYTPKHGRWLTMAEIELSALQMNRCPFDPDRDRCRGSHVPAGVC